ncbi:Ada metal-binding domain-containing protein [Bdellovibrio sp. NC01]|uniref:Ada metal-binding domain-containing protein n=1 Tax=Bdellovibrio sp. NC01 TaxID=2220073 RepID=UPI00115ACFE6|nr:Ada metal-binding domain-containing protein [Bdellovibrio sp. NC01]QDK36856.1 DNA-3-methyladenine glycosylase 2 family protein [Bdellovibrio sp. NC01]
MKKDDIFYTAMLARDHRFDGKFFVGVKTTGIYCRPICPAKPKRENVEFFANHHAAEKAGYRPCLRCRPESAPQSPAWVGTTAVVQRAIKVLNNLESIEFNEDRFAELFGLSARHLRRLFMEEVGKTPKQIAFENRLNLSRKLISETQLAMTEVAFASGFSSIRRFNDAFKERFKKTPSQIRRQKIKDGEPLRISLPYRPPFDFEGLMMSYFNHRVGDLEWFEDGKMHRIFSLNGQVGKVAISNDVEMSALMLEIDFPDTTMIHAIVTRVRNVFDLDSDPLVIANTLEQIPVVKKMYRKFPGVRLPSGWDPFEIAIAAILGQLVSIERGRSLVHDLMAMLGDEIEYGGKIYRLFPTAQQIVDGDLTKLKTTTARKMALKGFARAIAEGKLSLESTQDVDLFHKNILSIKGIGPWTANYIALKALRGTDVFPATDLILGRALQQHAKDILDKVSPWRGYLAALMWREYGKGANK